MRQLSGRAARRTVVAMLGLLIALGASRPALGRERLAVLMVVDGDPELADNLTEIAISTLAERRDRDLIGTAELRARIAGIVPAEGLGACLERAECLSQVAAAAGARQVVVGSVRREGGGWTLDLSLIDTRTGARDAQVARAVPDDAGVEGLISTVQESVRALVALRAPDSTVPLARLARLENARQVTLAAPPPAPARRRATWVPYVGFGATALAAICYSAAAVTGEMASAQPVGRTRADAQADLERRKDYAFRANGLLVAGTALAGAAVAAFVWWARAGAH